MTGTATDIIALPGLDGPVEILMDRWGVAHIRAGSDADLFYAQGFNAARERLWQIDLWRKRGLGLLARDFGPGFIEQDKAARHFLYRGDMAADWAAYAPDARQICEAFTAGINAYVDAALTGRQPMPPEFALMDTQPDYWQPEDVTRIRSHCLTRNLLSEVVRNNAIAAHGARADLLREELRPRVDPVFDPDVPPGSVPMEALEMFKLATAEVSFTPERMAATLEQAHLWRVLSPLGDIMMAAEGDGSNNWVVAGHRTATGRPMMASDPHRAHILPSIRYMVHLKGPNFDVIGGGEPVLPGIAIGHNGHSAFSFTIFKSDQEDMYVYRTDPEDPDRYQYGDGWEGMQRVDETIPVRGAPDQPFTMRFTRHGPVVLDRPGQAYAVRTACGDAGSAPYLASLSVMRAQDYGTYRKALESWGAPTLNHLYADVTGTIAWQTVGLTPIRGNWNGLVPMPGDGRYEWRGRLTLDQMPHARDPACGYLATANENNIPEGWDPEAAAAIGYEWSDASRGERIHAVLEADASHTLEAAGRLQNDVHSMIAERTLAVLGSANLADPAAPAAALLAGWDCEMTADSAQAMFLEYWTNRHLKPALFDIVSTGDGPRGLLAPGSIQSVLDLLERPGDWLEGAEPLALRDQILSDTLAAAWADAQANHGAPGGWRWGALHTLPLPHKLARVAPEAEAWSIPTMELGGNGSTPNNAIYRASDFQTLTGPSIRLLMDVGAWDNSLFVNLPGQSGNPDSPHYGDLAQAWLKGDYRPLAYSDDAVEAATEARLRLVPG
ncbi:penicillin acylase family protein [Pseudooceanicola sp. 216_PA32_1]|uniref:Penicillin acylase family protein n=1 Tax=Pseudooceanicola pacificus TaxID=2676438 RepID=A0A844WAQ6_9RHOB|nr:penicillin acylase family protein [Pseudooceanicola pacificus]MWB76832.1 penicillin acylase family protein [Pseudooceanicola pacificus]